MKKFFLSICFSLICVTSVMAETREFSSMEEAQANASVRNRDVIRQAGRPDEKQPTSEEEMVDFLRGRLGKLDITTLPKGERLDKISSFSKVDEDDEKPKKTLWEKIYDNAMARISGHEGVNTDKLKVVEYYEPKPETKENEAEQEQVPQINIKLPDGMMLRAAAYEHIPLFSTQIEILPNRILKVYDNIVVVANGKKVKEGLMRFFEKESVSGQNKIRLMLEDVKINGESFPYEIVEDNDLYIIRPVRQFELSPGVYVFEFSYLIDRALMDLNDFYEFYWSVTGSQFNLMTGRAIAALKLPGKEPAVKRFALTGRNNNLKDDNAVVMDGQDNTVGFMNLQPLREGESLHLFMTLPKIDFHPVTSEQQITQFLEDMGDIAISLVYFLTVVLSCLFSWHYVCKKLEFRKVTLLSAILIRALWRGGSDAKSMGGVFLELFRKNLIDIEYYEKGVILVRKTAHARHLSKFENKVLNVLFSKKDCVCKLCRGEKIDKLKQIIAAETEKQIRSLSVRLGGMYILANILMLGVFEVALCIWNPQALLFEILLMTDVVLLGALGCGLLVKGKLWRKIIFGILAGMLIFVAALLLQIYLSGIAVVLMLSGVGAALIFSLAVTGKDAMLKNAVKSVYQMRDFLLEQKDNIGSGRNFIAQQASIYVLDLEDKYPLDAKIKSYYRLTEIEELIKSVG